MPHLIGIAPRRRGCFIRISPNNKYGNFTHGLGLGDVNGDGRADLIEKDGWWEQPAALAGDPVWKFNKQPFGSGGSQMYAYDVNGDGLNDVITGLAAHAFGLAWFEQYKEGGAIGFREHVFMNKDPKENKYGVKFSELHAIDLVDMDGDGLKDIVTGKRFWSHGRTGDPDRNDAAVLYWFKLVRRRRQDRRLRAPPDRRRLRRRRPGRGHGHQRRRQARCRRRQQERGVRVSAEALKPAATLSCAVQKLQREGREEELLLDLLAASTRRSRMLGCATRVRREKLVKRSRWLPDLGPVAF